MVDKRKPDQQDWDSWREANRADAISGMARHFVSLALGGADRFPICRGILP